MGVESNVTLCKSCGSYVTNDIDIPSSPTPQLHRTLQAPDQSESTLISDSLSHARTGISQLDSEIEKMSVALNDLRNKRDGLHQFVIQHESLFSPIRRLPAEILNYIFFLCIPPRYVSSFNIQMAPLLLTRVCVGWRDSAWSSQRLWASFTVSSGSSFYASLMQAWLSHVKSSPLSPHLKLYREPQQVRRMWPVVIQSIQNCDRWQELILDISTSTLSRFGSVQHRLPWLECLTIYLHVGHHKESISAFEFAPRLRQVELKSAIRPSLLKLPWNQLTTLETRSDSLDTLLSILHLSNNLVNLRLNSSGSNIGTSRYTTATLPHLRSLLIRMPCDTSTLFDKIRCPGLQMLDLMTTAASWESAKFILFLNSCTSLHVLSVSHHTRSGVSLDLVPCLQAAPSVTTLLLNMGMRANWLMEEMLTQLTCTDSTASCLLPALTNLEVSKAALDARLFVEMAQSRIAPARPGMAQLQILILPLDSLAHFDQESLQAMIGIFAAVISSGRAWLHRHRSSQ